MLCIDVGEKIQNDRIKILFRKSMKKFDADQYSIDVIRTSLFPRRGFLNRQIIIILSSLGITNHAFLSIQHETIDKAALLTKDPDSAIEGLSELGDYGGSGYYYFLVDFIKTFKNNSEMFCRRLLQTLQAFLVKEVRTKARILVKNTWSLFGVADETSTLDEGEVFVQIQDPNSIRKARILTGPIIVTRNPCFHPGNE